MVVVFHDKIYKVLEWTEQTWPDNLFVLTRGTAADHLEELKFVLRKLEAHGNYVSIAKSQLFRREKEWFGCLIKEDGVETKATGTEAVMKTQPPKTAQ